MKSNTSPPKKVKFVISNDSQEDSMDKKINLNKLHDK
jgi:hypothetical protein